MNSVDRRSLANAFALLLFLLLVNALAADMDCASERQVEQTRQPASSERRCEMTTNHAAIVDLGHGVRASRPEMHCPVKEA